MEFIFASRNRHKLEELQKLLPASISLLALPTENIPDELPETGNSFEENAMQKAKLVFSVTNQNCFAEDSGLEVESLHNEPGIYSARFAGEGKSSPDNIRLLLSKLNAAENRKARFKTVIALKTNQEEMLFEGTCEGTITTEMKGESGFGYDPVFIPDGSEKTFAEMTIEEKSQFSHRAKAFSKLVRWLLEKKYID